MVCCTDTLIISYFNAIKTIRGADSGFHTTYVANVQQIKILTKIGTFGTVFTHFTMPLSITCLLFL